MNGIKILIIINFPYSIKYNLLQQGNQVDKQYRIQEGRYLGKSIGHKPNLRSAENGLTQPKWNQIYMEQLKVNDINIMKKGHKREDKW